MSEPYVGEIRMFAGNFAPVGWAICDGSQLSISENDVLFSLIGTTYGGDGVSTFKLPDLRGRAPMHKSSAYPLGNQGGTETVTLATAQMPAHTHIAQATTVTGTLPLPTGNVWAQSIESFAENPPNAPTTPLAPTLAVGGSQPHENMMPYLAVNYIISLFGLFPSTN